MGAVCCKPEEENQGDGTFGIGSNRVKSWKRPKWRSDEPITDSQLQEITRYPLAVAALELPQQRMREEFWETEPHYGGDRVIWDALRAACEADVGTARIILDSAGVIVAAVDMTICYDERGRKYELPRFVLTSPTNLSRDPGATSGGSSGRKSGSGRGSSGNAAQLELPAVAASGSGDSSGGSPDAPSPALDTAPLNQLAER